MKEFQLVAKGTKLVLEQNVLAVLSDAPLTTVGSAFHNGGYQQTRVVINTQVTQEYGDVNLHDDPEAFVQQAYKKLGLHDGFVGMVTFAGIADFALVSKGDSEAAVSVIATAGCTHGESSGEPIMLQEITGTINIIVLIDGNPNDSCLASCIITATEAKTAALQELDVRSRYSGTLATGTITDAVVIAKTGVGNEIVYSGPASPLGQLVGFCTRQAVKEAVMKAKLGGFLPDRPIVNRLMERHLPVDKLAVQLAKVDGLGDPEAIAKTLTNLFHGNSFSAWSLLAASALDEEVALGRMPKREAAQLSREFGALLLGQDPEKTVGDQLDAVDLPRFLKAALFAALKNSCRSV